MSKTPEAEGDDTNRHSNLTMFFGYALMFLIFSIGFWFVATGRVSIIAENRKDMIACISAGNDYQADWLSTSCKRREAIR